MKFIYCTLLLFSVWGFVVQCHAQSVILQGNIIHTSGAPLQVVVENDSTGAHLLATCDTNGNYSLNISSLGEHFPISCSFLNCDSTETDTVFTITDTPVIVTWNSDYCPPTKKVNATLSGHLSNTGGATVAIHIQVKDTTMIEDSLEALTDSGGNYTITLPYSFFNDSIKCTFSNCNNKSVDTVFVLKDTANTWNETFCALVTCPLSFTSSYCPCTNTFYLQLDTSNIPFTHWSVKWNFGDGDTSTRLFPSESFSSRSLYNVCVSLYDSTLKNPACNFCDTLGFNSTGNLVTRAEEGGGFNLLVIPAGTLQQYLNTPPNSFSLYPNPAGSEAGVMIYSDEATGYNVTITNLIGQQVISTVQNVSAGSSTFNMDVHTLTPGAYFMTIRFKYGQITNMFLKN